MENKYSFKTVYLSHRSKLFGIQTKDAVVHGETTWLAVKTHELPIKATNINVHAVS